jgi:rhodanese-related sulfurtransferase
MKKLIVILLIALTAAFAQQEKPTTKSKKLTRAEFDQLLAKPGQVLVIDVRRPDELTANGGFPVYLSIQLADLERHLAFIPKDRTLIAVSNHGNRALQAADLLDRKGFKVAGAIGLLDYEADGGTLVKIAPQPKTDGTVKGRN